MRIPTRLGLALAAALATTLTATGAHAATPTSTPTAVPAGLTGAAPCPDDASFTCSTLTVPLDRSGRHGGTLDLRVAMAGNANAPKGVLLFLTGGPGQPGEPFAARVTARLKPLMDQYRLVLIDQRGTGATALQCPQLQQEMGSSDLAAPTTGAVTDCAAALGDSSRFYSTADTVGDLEQLRRDLGVQRLTLDGVSYGSFVAERYALAHPQHVARLVLDSIVPQTGYDALDLSAMRAVPRVLAASCAATACTSDPAADVAAVVARDHNGVELLDTLTTFEFVDPNYTAMITALHESATGHPEHLQGIIAAFHQPDGTTAEQLSQGLHASTLCADGHYPWGTGDTPVGGRQAALDDTRRELTPADFGPFDAATATGTGSLLTCLQWPREPVPPSPSHHRRLPDVPVLLLGGDRDLSTPLEELYKQERLTPDARVVVVPGASHSVQTHATSDLGRQAVCDFLLHD